MGVDDHPRHEPTLAATASRAREAGVPSQIDERSELAPIDPVGETIDGRYRVEARIGRGGMARVYRAHHLGLRRDVAIKILHARLHGQVDAQTRFEREAHAASRLQHPNCVQVLDFGTTPQGVHYMVMELLAGHDLSKELGKAMHPERAIDLMVQILRGLQHAHEHGVVHRDIKPQNIFVTRDHEGREVLKILDFGLAKFVASEAVDPLLTQAGMVFGTPRYLSPEQAVGSADIDARTDIYSAGAVFFHMLAGHPPFEANETIALLHQHIAAPIPELPAGTPRRVRKAVAGMLAKHRDDRYATAKDVLAAVRPRPGNEAPAPIGRRPPARAHERDALALALERVAIDPKLVRVDGSISDTGVHAITPATPAQEIAALPRIELARPREDFNRPAPRAAPSRYLAVLVPLLVAVIAWLWWRVPEARRVMTEVIAASGVGSEVVVAIGLAAAGFVTGLLAWRSLRRR